MKPDENGIMPEGFSFYDDYLKNVNAYAAHLTAAPSVQKKLTFDEITLKDILERLRRLENITSALLLQSGIVISNGEKDANTTEL